MTERIVAVLGVEPMEDRDGSQRLSYGDDPVPMWTISVVYAPQYGEKVVLDIGVPATARPELANGRPIFTNLTYRSGANLTRGGKARQWAMWECEAIRFDTPQQQRRSHVEAAPATNGA